MEAEINKFYNKTQAGLHLLTNMVLRMIICDSDGAMHLPGLGLPKTRRDLWNRKRKATYPMAKARQACEPIQCFMAKRNGSQDVLKDWHMKHSPPKKQKDQVTY